MARYPVIPAAEKSFGVRLEAAGKTLDEILAVAALIGAAGTRRVRELGLNPKYVRVKMLVKRRRTKRPRDLYYTLVLAFGVDCVA